MPGQATAHAVPSGGCELKPESRQGPARPLGLLIPQCFQGGAAGQPRQIPRQAADNEGAAELEVRKGRGQHTTPGEALGSMWLLASQFHM